MLQMVSCRIPVTLYFREEPKNAVPGAFSPKKSRGRSGIKTTIFPNLTQEIEGRRMKIELETSS